MDRSFCEHAAAPHPARFETEGFCDRRHCRSGATCTFAAGCRSRLQEALPPGLKRSRRRSRLIVGRKSWCSLSVQPAPLSLQAEC